MPTVLTANIFQDIRNNLIEHDNIELEEFYSDEPKLEQLPKSTTENVNPAFPQIIADDVSRYDYEIPENEENVIKRFCAHKIKRILVLC